MMAKHLCVSLVLVFNVLMGSCLRSSAREKKAKCPTCSDITEAFKKGIENTEKANFGGGNTDWEERKLGSFATSETRLVEIMEGLCDESATECHAMVEEQEETLEDWWFKNQFEVNDMKTWLCVEKMKVCCPNGTYGPECSDCVGGKDTPCNGHGKCEGEGTREGSGHCTCDNGYEGELCDGCSDGYFEEQGEDSKPKCTACHISCNDECNGSSPKDCETCKDGWEWNEEEGCTDKNECEEEEKCEGGSYCMNNPGSYSCQACHDSCEGNCTGEGPKGCVECTSGYAMTAEEGCKDVDECAANATICESGKFCDNTPGSYVCQECHPACQTCIGEGSQGCTKCRLGYRMVDSDCKDIDECALDKHLCDKGTEKCINTVGSFSCGCKNGFKRQGATCVRKKGKKKTQETEKVQDHQLEEDLRKGNYFTAAQMKLGAVLYALFFACVIAAVMKRSRIGLIVLIAGYACFLWYLRR